MSFEFNISPKDRAASRFIGAVMKTFLKAALAEKDRSGLTQQAIATKLGVDRSLINRLLRGEKNLTLRSIGEIAWALGRKPVFDLVELTPAPSNHFVTATASTPANGPVLGEMHAPISSSAGIATLSQALS